MSAFVGPTDPKVIWGRYAGYRGAVAFDVGANGGAVTRLLAPNFDHVVAFEPCEESWKVLATVGLDNVTAVPAALSDHTGVVRLVEAEEALASGELVTGDTLASSWGTPLGERVVACMTLDEAADAYGVPDFVKIDTEGHEALVIRGALKTLAYHKPRLLIEVHAAVNGQEIVDLLHRYRFERVEHPGYPEDSDEHANHYYLIGVAA